MSGTSVIKQVTGSGVNTVDLRVELLSFIDSVRLSVNTNTQIELVNRGLHLLQHLPASRDAVLEYFTSIYEKALVKQLEIIENERLSSTGGCQSLTDDLLNHVNNSLSNFVSSSSNTWTLVVSKWTIELLGILSSKYSMRGYRPGEGSLSDSLNQWMFCLSTRSLIDINIKCLNILINTRSESTAIYNLLDNCVVHSPNLDWAVARVASQYPYIVTKRVFTWGLQHFLASDPNAQKNAKTVCLGAILTHLTGCYSTEIQTVMTHIIKWSVDEENEYGKDLPLDKGGAIPYLLHLSTLSPELLNTLTHTPLQTFKFEDLEKYTVVSDRWCRLAGGRQIMLEMTSNFILSIQDSAHSVIYLLMKSSQHSNPTIRITTQEIIELLLKELDKAVLGCEGSNQKGSPPLLKGLLHRINWLIPYLLSDDEFILHLTTSLIKLIGVEHTSVLSKSICYLLLRCKNEDQLVSVINLSTDYETSVVLSPAVSQALSNKSTHESQEYIDPKLLWINLSKLLKWESSGTLVSLGIEKAVRDNMTGISEILSNIRDSVDIAHVIADVIKRSLASEVQSSSKPMTVHETTSLVQAIISYFYICLTQTDNIEELKGIRLVTDIIRKLCQQSNVARTLVIRELLESSLLRSPNILFGATREPFTTVAPNSNSNVSLLDENYRQGTCSLLAQRHSVLHAGVIESFKRKYDAANMTQDNDKVTHSTRLLISAIRAACSSDTEEGFIESAISVSLLLVELISPDVMYNGLPWPEQEFCKVTVERDLYIRRFLDQVPLVWSLLSYLAYYRPALCYCSVILRALIATLISQWSLANQQGRKAGHCTNLIEITSKVLNIMTLGQLLPPPLSNISDALYSLQPIQVVEVLKECVWNYMRSNVPSPALFTRDSNGVMWRDSSVSKPPKQYTEPLRLAILSNIDQLGNLYNILFVHEHDEE